MKILKINIISLFFIICLFNVNVFAQDYKTYATYTVNNLTITSYSKNWTKEMLKSLYLELLNNFHSDEFHYLSSIYIYPDSPEGVNGLYYDDIYIEDNQYKKGGNACINLYNGERFNTISKMAYTLSHEYGHHYMTYNLLKEGIYYNNLKDSKYMKIRNLEGKPVVFNGDENNYLYHWDIMEIMADDYVQLLGSSNAKISYKYKSVDELLKENKKLYDDVLSFNLKPQLNPYLPLAADTDGLYNYLVSLGGFTVTKPKVPTKPKLKNITGYVGDNKEITYNISWDNVNKNEPLEYTLVIYPDDNPFTPYPLKTLTSKEPLNVTFGSYSIKQKDGTLKTISQKYTGKYILKLYMKDSLGFIYTADTVNYDFNQINKKILADKDNKKIIPKANNKVSNNINEKPSSAPDDVIIGPSSSGNLNSLFNLGK